MATSEFRIKYKDEPARTQTPRMDAAKSIVAPWRSGFKEDVWIDDLIQYALPSSSRTYEDDPSYDWREDKDVAAFGSIYSSMFEFVKNKQQALDIKEEIETELSNAQSPGYTLFRILGIATDPLIWTGPKIIKGFYGMDKLNRLQKAGAVGTTFTGLETIQEGLRQAGSITRPAELSYMTIAGVGAISTVIGGFASKSIRHKNLANNPKLVKKIAEHHDSQMSKMESKLDPASRFFKVNEKSNLRPVQVPKDIEKTLKDYDVSLNDIRFKGADKGTYAQFNPKTLEITWDSKAIKQAWKDNKIQNRTIPGIKGKKVKNLFRSWQEFAQFVIRHEVVHARFPRLPKESKIAHEVRTNTQALKEWNEQTPIAWTFNPEGKTQAIKNEMHKMINWWQANAKEGIIHYEGNVLDPYRIKIYGEPTLQRLKKYIKRNPYTDISKELQLSKTGIGIELLPDALNKRFYNSLSVNARLASQILDQPGFLEMGKQGKTLGLSGERWTAKWKGSAIYNYSQQEEFYRAYKTRMNIERGQSAEKAGYPTWKLMVRRQGIDPTTKKELSMSEFLSRSTLYRNPRMRDADNPAIYNEKKIPEIIKASKHQTPFYKWADDQLHTEGTYVAFATTMIRKIEHAIYRAQKTGGPVAFNSAGKEMSLKRLQGELAHWRDVKKLRETKRFNASTYFPLVKNQGLIKTEKKEFISLIQRPTKERPEGLTPAQALKEYEKIQKINYFKPMDGDAVGWASSLHRRDSAIDWLDPKLSKYLITDPKRLQLYYAKSMGADFWLANFNRQFASKRQVALHGSKGRLSKEQLKEHHTDNSLRDLLQLVNDDYVNAIKQLGGRLSANPYNYQFKIEPLLRSPVVAKSASMKSQIKFTKPKDPNLFWGKPKQYKGTDMEGVTAGSKEPDLIDVSKNNKNHLQIKEILKERTRVLSDIRAARDLLRGTYGLSDNPTGVKSTIIRSFKSFNTLTMLQGFQSAYPDLGRIAYFNGLRNSFGGQLQQLTEDLVEWKKMAKVSRKNAMIWEEAVDWFVATRARAQADLNEFTSFAHKSERVLDTVSTLNFAFVNAMSTWNTIMKEIAGMSWQTTVIPVLKQWGKTGEISQLWRRRFARAGLATEGEASKVTMDIVRELNKAEGVMKGKILRIANTDNWTNKKAIDAFNGAMSHDIPIQIVTPGKGDVALWTNKEYGGLIAQFKKFTQAATNRVLMAGLQEGPQQFALQMAYMIPLGMFVDYMRTEHAFGHDWSKKPFLSKLYDGIERSALLGYFTDIDRTMMAWSNNQIGVKALLGVAPQYGTSLQRKLGAVPTLGAAATFGKVFTDTVTGEYDWHTARNVRRLLPFQNVFWLDSIFDKLEKGLRP